MIGNDATAPHMVESSPLQALDRSGGMLAVTDRACHKSSHLDGLITPGLALKLKGFLLLVVVLGKVREACPHLPGLLSYSLLHDLLERDFGIGSGKHLPEPKGIPLGLW